VAGPLAVVVVIGAWGGLVILGFALMLWPHFPGGFATADGVELGGDGFVDALYVSLVSLTSLGYGDVVATGEFVRFLGPLETLIGLGLLTASITWILLLYRVLSDYRSLSHEISLVLEAGHRSGIGLAAIESGVAARALADLTSRVVATRDDLLHSPIAYYFHPREARHALPVLLPRLVELVSESAGEERGPGLRFEAAILIQAVEDLLEVIAREFVGAASADPALVLAAYRRDHLWGTP
jgi:hypothetical protein